MDNKPPKKVVTNDASIDNAEAKLGVKFPQILREKLKEHNGFTWGFFERFYPVFDEEDKFHTFDDVVRENENPNGWKRALPEGFVAIADDGGGYALVLSTNKDGKVYHYNNDTGDVTLFAENDEELKKKLDEQDMEMEKIKSED